MIDINTKEKALDKTIKNIECKLGEHIFNQEYVNITNKIANRIPRAIINGKEYVDLGYAQFLSNLYVNYLYKSLRNVKYSRLLLVKNRSIYNYFDYKNCIEMNVTCSKQDFDCGMKELEKIGAIRILDDKYSIILGSKLLSSHKSTINGEVMTIKKLISEMSEFIKIQHK